MFFDDSLLPIRQHAIYPELWKVLLAPYGISKPQWVNSLWSSDTIWWHKCGSTLVQVILVAWWHPSHYLIQCWLLISEVPWHSPESSFSTQTTTCVCILFNSLRPSDAIWRQWFWTTLAQVMACCLTAPSHYLNQCWLIIRGVLWHTSESSFAGIAQGIDSGYEFEKDILKNIFKSPRGQWVNEFENYKLLLHLTGVSELTHFSPDKNGNNIAIINTNLFSTDVRTETIWPSYNRQQ